MKYMRWIIAVIVVFIFGLVSGFSHNWYMTGMFGAKMRSIPKEKRIILYKNIGMKISPVRLRDVLLATYPEQPAEEHELAHLIGETAYAKFGTAGFRYCDSVFTFACYHGVILAAIRARGYQPSVLLELAQGCEKAGKNRTADISCAHGIGHGLMWVRNYNLLQSFEACDGVFEKDRELRFFCWDGVSMENVVRRGNLPNGMAATPIDAKNMYAPCDTLPSQYQPACVREHVFLARLVVLDRDTIKTSEYCLHFSSEDVRQQCFGAIGGALYQDDPQTPDRIIVECGKVPSGYYQNCIGVASRHYGFSGRPEMATKLCESLGKTINAACLAGVKEAGDSLYTITPPR